ncbi:hypothetical protein GCM10009525_08240 [Streptosporangium amethystogenes subsp. fukuiense]
MPPTDAGWGRLYIKYYAVKSLLVALEPEGRFGLSPSLEYAKSATASQYKSNDTYDLLCVLQVIDFCMANGDNAISG